MHAQQSEPRQLVRRVVEQPNRSGKVLHMCGLHEPETPVLPVGDPASRELELDEVTVMSGAHQDSLVTQPHPLFMGVKDPVDDGTGLARRVVAPDQNRPATTRSRSLKRQADSGLGRPDQVRQVQDGLNGPEIVLERDDGRPRQRARQVVQVPCVGAAEAVDGLRVITHDGEPTTIWSKRAYDLDLQRVDVLILVDEHMIEHRDHVRPKPVVAECGAPQEQQVVEIHLTPGPLAGDILLEQGGNGLGVTLAPGKVRRQHLTEAMPGVDAPRVDLDKGGRARHADVSCIKAVLVSQQVHHVGGVCWIEKREPRL